MASAFTAAAASLCRLCRGPVVTKNSVALFSNSAVLERLGERIGILLQTTVAVVRPDQTPSVYGQGTLVYQSCTRRNYGCDPIRL